MTTVPRPTGLGMGWRSEMALEIEQLALERTDAPARLAFVEVLAEDLDPYGPLPLPLEKLRRHGIPVIPHAIGLNLGGAEPLDLERLAGLARLAERLEAPLVSEHLSFARAGGIESGHLLPLPRTRDAVEVVVENVRRAKAALPVPLALENVSTLFEWPGAEMNEAEFLVEVLNRADVLLLLDVENVYANALNHRYDPLSYLDAMPLYRIAYVHIAGGVTGGELYHDTHTAPVPRRVLELLEELSARTVLPGVMLERDDDFPRPVELSEELTAIRAALERGRVRREACHVG